MVLYVVPQERPREVRLKQKKRSTTRPSSPSQPFFRLSLSRKSSTVQSNAKRRIVSTSVSFAKLWRNSVDGSVRPPTAGATSAPDARLLFAAIDAATLSTKEIGAIVVVLRTIAVATTAAPPMERRSATVANAWLVMGIPLITISLESGSLRLAARKTARARAPRAKCTAIRVARQSMSGLNAWRTRPIKRSRQ